SLNGRTVLLVSHNMAAMRLLCQKGALLRNGKLVSVGPIDEVINMYQTVGPNSAAGDLSTDGFKLKVFVSKREVYRGDPVTLGATFFRKSGTSVTEAAFLIYNTSGIRVSVIDLRRLLLDQQECVVDNFTV